MKSIRFFFIFFSFSLLLGAKAELNFSILGLEGPLLMNVKTRLQALEKTQPLNQESDAALSLQIQQALQPFGYFKPQIFIQRNPLRIRINPGPQLRINSLSIQLKGEGADNVALNKVLNQLPIAEGKPLLSEDYEKTKQLIEDSAESLGYLKGQFEKAEIRIDLKNYRSEITMIFDTGSQYYFGQVQFDPARISPQLLERYLPFHPGQAYSTDQILTFNTQLVKSGYFRVVSVKPQLDSKTQHIPIQVHLEPVPRSSYSLGLGYGTDTGIRGRAGFQVVPLNSSGHKLNLLALGSTAQSALKAQYTIPGKNPVTDLYQISANLSALNYESGYSRSTLFSLSQQHKLGGFQRVLSLNNLFEYYHYNSQPRENKTTFFPKASFSWKNTGDNLFSPTGYNVSVHTLGASKVLLSQENFIQASINAKAAYTFEPLRMRFYFHSIQGLTQINRINQLPLSLALLLGGAENLKAYDFNSIGPGKIATYNGLEIQKEFKKNWYFTGFFDCGDVYKPTPRKFKKDLGLGLLWVSPVGPIKIGVAKAINAPSRHRKGIKFVLSMGPDL